MLRSRAVLYSNEIKDDPNQEFLKSPKPCPVQRAPRGNAISLAESRQADLSEAGEPDTWVILPEELWLDSWRWTYAPGSKVVVRLKESLYGHPLAGKLW